MNRAPVNLCKLCDTIRRVLSFRFSIVGLIRLGVNAAHWCYRAHLVNIMNDCELRTVSLASCQGSHRCSVIYDGLLKKPDNWK